MADTKISALSALLGSETDPAADLLPIVDVSAGASGTKKITVAEFLKIGNHAYVDVYADDTARDAAIPSPSTGHRIYNREKNAEQVYTGTYWRTIGHSLFEYDLVPDLDLWAEYGIGLADGASVDEWTSHDSNHYLFIQAVDQPVFDIDALNGRPGVYFEGSEDTTTGDNMAVADPSVLSGTKGCVFVVCSVVAGTGNQAFLATADDGGASNYLYFGMLNTEVARIAGAVAGSATSRYGTNVNSGVTLFTYYLDDSNYQLRINGSNDAIAGSSGGNMWAGDIVGGDLTSVGAMRYNSTAVAHCRGTIGRILAYNNVTLTAQEVSDIENELKALYGIS